MDLVLDGLIYETQARGGISRTYNEILPRMGSLDPSLRMMILTCGQLMQRLPDHPRITHHALTPVTRYLRPGWLWRPVIPAARAFVLGRRPGQTSGQVWHSTYYTRPNNWLGPEVTTIVDMIPERFPKLFHQPLYAQFRRQKRACALAADAIVCTTETAREDVVAFYGVDPARVHVTPLAPSAVFRPTVEGEAPPPLPCERPFLLYVGERYHYKNFVSLLRAYGAWSMRGEIDLVAVGRPWSRAEREELAQLGLGSHVHLLTEIEDARLRWLYCQATAFVFPSLYEGFGIPVLEALACGCPVVASRIPSTLEVASDCPFYFELDRPESVHDALDRAVAGGRDPWRIQRGLNRVRGYSWDRTARQTLDICLAVCT